MTMDKIKYIKNDEEAVLRFKNLYKQYGYCYCFQEKRVCHDSICGYDKAPALQNADL